MVLGVDAWTSGTKGKEGEGWDRAAWKLDVGMVGRTLQEICGALCEVAVLGLVGLGACCVLAESLPSGHHCSKGWTV